VLAALEQYRHDDSDVILLLGAGDIGERRRSTELAGLS
jgi:hypothetical protein